MAAGYQTLLKEVVSRQAVAVAVANTRKPMIKFRVARRTRRMALKARDPRWRKSKKVMTLLKSGQADELDVADTLRQTMVKFGLAARPKRMKHVAALKMKKLPVTLVEEYLHRQLQKDQGYVQEVEPHVTLRLRMTIQFPGWQLLRSWQKFVDRSLVQCRMSP